jgi:hypothetical protein
MVEDTIANSKWQPVIVMLRRGGRLECSCGSLAVIVLGELGSEAKDVVEGVDYYCQACYLKALQEEVEA